MIIYKFGGASVKSADAVKNVAHIIKNYATDKVCIIVSAMGKTTNHLEEILGHYVHGRTSDYLKEIEILKSYHLEIMEDLFTSGHPVYEEIENIFDQLESKSKRPVSEAYSFEYDQVVSLGEVLSTKIIAAFLIEEGLKAKWLDARKMIRTDNKYREAHIDWQKTDQLVKEKLDNNKEIDYYITQGFLGHTAEGFTTTLGREGSDFTAAIFAYVLDAKSVTIWKDVPGMLNADPKWFNDTVRLPQISFKEAIELAYYGASVIHPKTIKPLQNKNIPLYVKSFVNPDSEGSVISESSSKDHEVPSYIFKMNQVLISFTPKDFSFIAEDNLSIIFSVFHKQGIRINLMQNSAIKFSVSVDASRVDIEKLTAELGDKFDIQFNEGLELLTVRHYDEATIEKVTKNKKIFVEQRSRITARMVMKNQN